MALSGKYNFKGIKELGASGLRGAFSLSPYTAWINKFPATTDFILEFIANWLANKGLIILNIGAIYLEGEFNQAELDAQMDQAISEIKNKGGRDKLTPKEIKDIDDAVIKSARKFIVITRPK